MSRTMYGLYFQGSVRVVLFCSKVPSLAFTDLKPKDVLDSATERSKKERPEDVKALVVLLLLVKVVALIGVC